MLKTAIRLLGNKAKTPKAVLAIEDKKMPGPHDDEAKREGWITWSYLELSEVLLECNLLWLNGILVARCDCFRLAQPCLFFVYIWSPIILCGVGDLP
jgi:hypothetical protein